MLYEEDPSYDAVNNPAKWDLSVLGEGYRYNENIFRYLCFVFLICRLISCRSCSIVSTLVTRFCQGIRIKIYARLKSYNKIIDGISLFYMDLELFLSTIQLSSWILLIYSLKVQKKSEIRNN